MKYSCFLITGSVSCVVYLAGCIAIAQVCTSLSLSGEQKAQSCDKAWLRQLTTRIRVSNGECIEMTRDLCDIPFH
jgi:hypothetical protein